MSGTFLHDPEKPQVLGQCISVKVNVVFYVELIALKTWCGAEEVQKYSSTCLEFTNCYFLTFCFSVAKTITDGVNTLKKALKYMKPLEGGEWKLSPSLILTLNPRFPAEVDSLDLVW